MSVVEEQIIQFTRFKPEKKYNNRQDYLCALAVASSRIPNEEFDLLTDETVNWCNAALAARKAGQVIKDFDDDYFDGTEGEEPGTTEIQADQPSDTVVQGSQPEAPSDTTSETGKKRKRKGKKGVPVRNLTGEIDKFGIAVGTKAHTTAMLLEKGCTMADIKRETGEVRYNLLKRLERDGHKVSKIDGKLLLKHKDEE